jgi:hypothetical protein
MAAAPVATFMSNAPDLALIQKQIIDATREMFDRAISSVPADSDATEDHLIIADDKDELGFKKVGSLQDCEFGMILVLAREWCNSAGIETEFFNSSRFEQVVLLLVNRVVDRVLQVDQQKARLNDGGEGKKKPDGKLTAFFTGEPYTEKGKLDKCSANLDAAMITIAFLAPAVSQYNEQLVKYDYKLQGLPDWAQNLRDAALYAILDGLRYALDCQILVNKKCQGFTCDPNTRDLYPADGGFTAEREYDRLFFTWTACETIREIAKWRESYLKNPPPPRPPQAAIDEFEPLIKQLEEALLQAASWCKSNFYTRFEEFEVPETKELIEREWSPGKQEDINKLEKKVQHVYHISQYAAIRSLAPEGITLNEVRTVVDKLDTLVQTSIMDSGLDASDDKFLFKTLTREYWLGTSRQDSYTDDAWYPLVVRSLSGLLSRTLGGIGRKYSRTDVDDLTNAFEESLKWHVDKLLQRRPEGGEDGKLWSFAYGQPYVLYATQRTVFALITYGDFLTEVARFRTGVVAPVAVGGLRQEMSSRAAQMLADTLLSPIIDEMVRIARVHVAREAPPGEGNGLQVPLPEEPWAAGIIRDVLALFTNEFKESYFANNIWQRASTLINVRDTTINHPVPHPIPDSDRTPLANCHRVMEEIFKIEPVGQRLRQSTWETKDVAGILLEQLFREYMALPNGSFDAVLKSEKSDNLWKLIDRAKRTQDSFTKK